MAINWQVGYYRYRRYFTNLGAFYQSKKVRTYAELVLSILTVTFFLVFAVRPTLITIAGLTKQIDDSRLVTEKFQQKINDLSQAQREYGLIENDLYLIDQALPTHPEVTTLIKQLEALGRRSGIIIESTKFGQINITRSQSEEKKAEAETETSQSVKLSFIASGEYQKLKDFLHSLSSLRRVILIDSFGFKASKTDDQTLTLDIEAKAYYLKSAKD